eukprot:359601-Chlamydomonas_euryale.AAC.5
MFYVEIAISGLKWLFCDTKNTIPSFFEGGKFLTTSHNFAFVEEKASGCQPGNSLGYFRTGLSLTKLKLSSRMLHSTTASADRHIMDSWAHSPQGHLSRWRMLSGAGRHCEASLRLASFRC